MAEGYVVKIVYDSLGTLPRWVRNGSGKGIGPREHATVFPNFESANDEAQVWKAIRGSEMTVLIEPA
jgi:hypothetical protein